MWFVCSDGSVFTLCPVAPFGASAVSCFHIAPAGPALRSVICKLLLLEGHLKDKRCHVIRSQMRVRRVTSQVVPTVAMLGYMALQPMLTELHTGHFLPGVERLHQSVAELDDGTDGPDAATPRGTRATTRAWLQRAFPAAARGGGGQNGGSAGERCAFEPWPSYVSRRMGSVVRPLRMMSLLGSAPGTKFPAFVVLTGSAATCSRVLNHSMPRLRCTLKPMATTPLLCAVQARPGAAARAGRPRAGASGAAAGADAERGRLWRRAGRPAGVPGGGRPRGRRRRPQVPSRLEPLDCNDRRLFHGRCLPL